MSAKVTIRFAEDDLHARVKGEASTDKRSLNAEILILLAEALDTRRRNS